jgi:hypothetical protein
MPTDDSELLPSSPYTKTRIFAGVFEVGELKTAQLSIEIAYSLTNGHPPAGIIRGTSADYRAIEGFFRANHGSLCTLHSVSRERESIVCTDVRIRRLTEKLFPKDEQSTIHQVLGYFAFERANIRTEFRTPASEKKRQATFILAGPSRLWLSFASRTHSYTGDISITHSDPALPLDTTRDRVSTSPHFVYVDYLPVKGTPRQTGQAELFSLVVDDAFELERNGTAFIADSTALVEKLCLLMSFLSKAYITWFTCNYSDGSEVLQSYLNVRTTEAEAPDFEEVILETEDIRPFINQALAGYDKSTAAGFDLRIPMLYYIWAQSSRFVEDRFTTLFFTLEKLLSSLDERDPEDDLLTAQELSKLWKVMRPALEEMGKTPYQIDLVLAKRAELKRSPLMHRIERHLNALEISVTDIGGAAGLRKMAAVRNLLAHEKGEVPIETVIYETHRLVTVVERVFLKLLSWNGKHRTPTYNNRPIRGEDT